MLQACDVASGNDFTSIIAGLGKSIFFEAIFRYADFICAPGVMHKCDTSSVLGFAQLVPCAYYLKHKLIFISLPQNTYVSMCTSNSPPSEQHALSMRGMRKVYLGKTNHRRWRINLVFSSAALELLCVRHKSVSSALQSNPHGVCSPKPWL